MVGIPLAIFYLNFGPALAFTLLRGGIFAERFLFTSTLGFVLLLLIGIIVLSRKLNFFQSKPASFQAIPLLAVSSLIFLLYSFKTVDRNKVWRDNYTLFSTDIKTGQNSAQNQRHFAEQTLVRAMGEKDSLKQIELAKESLKAFAISLKMHPKFAESYLKTAVVYQLYLNDADKAIQNYKKCIECEPSRNLRAEAYYNLGTVYQNNKADMMYASYCYNQALQFNPKFEAAIVARDALKAVGINNLLEPINQKVDTLNGERNANYYFSIAYDFASKGNYNKAIENFNEVLKMNPTSLDALLNLGNCYGMLGEFQKSINYNIKVIQYHPNDKRPWKNNAINYEKLGNKVKMQECLERVNAMN
jgi:tetratricopeptide (TPR) repeat protein